MSVTKLALGGGALAAGLAAGWLGGGLAALAGSAVLVAAMNGYSKAYSP